MVTPAPVPRSPGAQAEVEAAADKNRSRQGASAWVAAVATWVLIVLGGVVRVTGSGMGCPDWPRCFGQWLPPAERAALLEVAHRVAAGTVSALVIVAAIVAWRHRSSAPTAWRAALAGGLLLVVQIGLGAWTVFAGNRPDTVVVHLVAALVTLGALTWAGVFALEAAPAATAREDAAAWARAAKGVAAALVVLTLLLATLGGAVQVTGGGVACPDVPTCQGSWWPAAAGLPAQLHMVHRYLAVAVGALVAALYLPGRRHAPPGVRRWLSATAALYIVQLAVGTAQVVMGMPSALRWLHLALGAATWWAVAGLAAAIGRHLRQVGAPGGALPASGASGILARREVGDAPARSAVAAGGWRPEPLARRKR